MLTTKCCCVLENLVVNGSGTGTCKLEFRNLASRHDLWIIGNIHTPVSDSTLSMMLSMRYRSIMLSLTLRAFDIRREKLKREPYRSKVNLCSRIDDIICTYALSVHVSALAHAFSFLKDQSPTKLRAVRGSAREGRNWEAGGLCGLQTCTY